MLSFYLTMLDSPEDEKYRQDFLEFYETYRDVMYQTAYQILHNRENAEDAVHDAFLSILTQVKKVDLFGQGRSYGLAVVLARNRAIDIQRRIKPTIPLEDVLDAELLMEIEEIPEPQVLLDALPNLYSTVLTLRGVGFTPAEISKLQNTKIRTVYKQLSRGKKMLQKLLEEEKERKEKEKREKKEKEKKRP